MRFLHQSMFCLAIVVFALGLIGCGKSVSQTSETPDADNSNMAHSTEGDHADHAGHAGHAEHEASMNSTDHAGHAEMSDDMAKMKEALVGLTAEDRASAEKQHFCPVSGNMLGTMGVPTKIQVDGREVWICCPGCEGQLRAKSGEYLAKLDR